MMRLFKWRKSWTTTLQFGTLFTGSELSQQIIIRKIWNDEKKTWRRRADERLSLDWGSVARYAIWGFAIFPHILRRWYALLDGKLSGNTWSTVVAKTCVDQLFFPLPILASFYVFLSALEGKTQSLSDLFEECNVKLWATLKARYCFMLPAQFINFTVIAPQHRVLYVGCTTFLWLNVLCIYKRLDLKSDVFHSS